MSSIETIRGRDTRVDQFDGSSSAVLARMEAVLTQVDDALAQMVAEYVFDTVALMKADTAIVAGHTVRTLGYFAVGDGGGALYSSMTQADFVAIADGIVDHVGFGGMVFALVPGSRMRAEWAGAVLSSGAAVARGDRFNAAFWYAEENGLGFDAHSDFLARAPLQMTTRSGGTFSDMDIIMTCTITAQSGGGFTDGGTLANGTVYGPHSQSRPIPLIHFKGSNSKIRWPRLECENVCAGVKLKANTANVHLYPEVRGFSRYGWWPNGNNDSKTFEPLIKQMYRDPDWMTSVGLDPLDWSEWNGDCIVIATKDFMFTSGQVGWGGPGVRFLDGLPADDAARIPGQNCYWCGLSIATDYLDGDNGAGDVMMPDLHIMQGISNTAFLDIGAGPRNGAWMDWDLATGQQVIRVEDSCIGVLSFCKVSNLSFMEGLDNDSCVHFLYGAQVEFATERPGSSGTTQTSETQTVHILDPRVRVFASRGGGGGTRYPFMTSMHRMRHMCIGFFTNPAEIYWNGSALVTGSTAWDGNWDEWNKLNRASGTFGGQQRYRGFVSEPTATGPSTPLAGDYWVVQGSISFTAGADTVTATDGQLLWAIVNAPAAGADWLVVNADSAPLRDTQAFETEARAHQTIVYPGDDEGVPQRRIRTPGAFFREEWGFTGSAETITKSWNGVEYRIEATTSPTNLYLDGVDTGLSVNGATMTFVNSGTETWQMLQTDSVLRPFADDTAKLGSVSRRIAQAFIKELYLGAGATGIRSGAGSPEAAVTAPVGTLYLRSDGGASTTMYIKESGTGNTGWVAK